MQAPVEITFQHCEPSEEARSEIVKQAERLGKFSARIMSCHVVVTGPQPRHRSGGEFKIGLRIAMRQQKDIVVNGTHGDAPENEHVLVAIRHAFTAAQRQIEDEARTLRGQVKAHVVEAHGHVTKFLAGEDCGFIETADGREVYFHRNAVLDRAFDRLAVGAEVRFVEEEGEKGAQASTVRLIGKHHLA